ncbi:NACHT domain-containing protein [Clostridium estertheticum]|uniref:NACHT domain-containing protein n=1 Tax=Clostridium estertheticum TaxID=238834 RepID=UPI001C7D33C5|nr:NACHT domain-containing protein [Clostridium estertheticum]MBX4261938.1 NACHT domain-containing protein [Clostridium estertheticum]WLC68626.1 NACHT domain-containing protein [Clostridium estertheticum]
MADREELIEEIVSCNPLNEAEVETKILLNIFKLLGFTHNDRADKIAVEMYFGREKKIKVADFILYNGTDRSAQCALIAVETKRIGESLDGAENQVISYSAWVGAPYYMVCNGEKLLISRNNPQSINVEKVLIDIDFDVVNSFANKTKVLINKERIDYLNTYYPKIEMLPSAEFFSEYLSKLKGRFSYHSQIIKPLSSDEELDIYLPITIVEGLKKFNIDELTNKVINDQKVMLIEGPPGCGKTTICSRLTTHLIEQICSKRLDIVPIYISLRDKVPTNTFNAFEFSCKQLGVRVFQEIYKNKIEESSIIIILDGLDEIPDIESGVKSLIKLMSQGDIHSLIITSRPHVVEKLNPAKLGISKCHIQELIASEIKSVAEKFNVSLDTDSSNALLDLSSPLQLLMYVKLKMEGFGNKRVTIYNLYIEYIAVLTKYFNNNDNESYIYEILRVLKLVSVEVVRNANINKSISINEMYTLIKHEDKECFSDLIRCGLITSKDNQLSFMHKSFEEFGVAYGLVEGIKSNTETEIKNLSLNSWNSYYIASEGLNEEDIDNIIELLDSKSSKIRKKLVGVLKYTNYPLYPKVRLKLIEVLKIEKSKKVVRSIFRILVQTAESTEGFIELLKFDNIERPRKEYYLSCFDQSYMIEIDDVYSYIDKYKSDYLGSRISYWLILLAIQERKAIYHKDFLVEMILSERFYEQVLIFEKLISHRDECGVIIDELYKKLDSPSRILFLLYLDRQNLSIYSEESMEVIINHLKNLGTLSTKDRKRFNEILTQKHLSKKYNEIFEQIINSFS